MDALEIDPSSAKQAEAFDLMGEHQMHCKRKTRVIPEPGKPSKRVLLECSLIPGKCDEDDITIETGTRHTAHDLQGNRKFTHLQVDRCLL